MLWGYVVGVVGWRNSSVLSKQKKSHKRKTKVVNSKATC